MTARLRCVIGVHLIGVAAVEMQVAKRVRPRCGHAGTEP